MLYKISRYKFKLGKKRGKKKLCPLSLEEIKSDSYEPVLPKGKILVKRPDYALFKVSRNEPVVQKLLRYTSNRKDNSRSFIVMYVRNVIVGYKTKQSLRFLPFFNNKNYMEILEEYLPKSMRKK